MKANAATTPRVWRLVNRATGAVVLPRLILADTFWRRFVGLQFRPRLEDGAGLLLAPCNAVHTCWMRFAIDAAFLDRTGMVLAVRHHLPPWRATWPVQAAIAVLEVPASTLAVVVGDSVRLEGPPSPSVLAGWR